MKMRALRNNINSKHIINKSVRAGYEELGIEGYYKAHSEDYSNPHIKEIEYLLKQEIHKSYFGTDILDLCCGGGEVTNILKEYEEIRKYNIEGLDPYTAPAYKKNTGKDCLIYDFKDIVQGALENKKYHTIISSFAMHLCDESMLNSLLYQLSLITNTLVIITPHKRPEIKNWWEEVEKIKYNGITLKVYRNLNMENKK